MRIADEVIKCWPEMKSRTYLDFASKGQAPNPHWRSVLSGNVMYLPHHSAALISEVTLGPGSAGIYMLTGPPLPTFSPLCPLHIPVPLLPGGARWTLLSRRGDQFTFDAPRQFCFTLMK